CELRHLRNVIRIGDAEPHGHRKAAPDKSRITADARDERGGVYGYALLCAGDPYARDGVNKTFGVRGDGLKSLIGTGGRGKKNRRESCAAHFSEVFGCLFDDQV